MTSKTTSTHQNELFETEIKSILKKIIPATCSVFDSVVPKQVTPTPTKTDTDVQNIVNQMFPDCCTSQKSAPTKIDTDVQNILNQMFPDCCTSPKSAPTKIDPVVQSILNNISNQAFSDLGTSPKSAPTKIDPVVQSILNNISNQAFSDLGTSPKSASTTCPVLGELLKMPHGTYEVEFLYPICCSSSQSFALTPEPYQPFGSINSPSTDTKESNKNLSIPDFWQYMIDIQQYDIDSYRLSSELQSYEQSVEKSMKIAEQLINSKKTSMAEDQKYYSRLGFELLNKNVEKQSEQYIEQVNNRCMFDLSKLNEKITAVATKLHDCRNSHENAIKKFNDAVDKVNESALLGFKMGYFNSADVLVECNRYDSYLLMITLHKQLVPETYIKPVTPIVNNTKVTEHSDSKKVTEHSDGKKVIDFPDVKTFVGPWHVSSVGPDVTEHSDGKKVIDFPDIKTFVGPEKPSASADFPGFLNMKKSPISSYLGPWHVSSVEPDVKTYLNETEINNWPDINHFPYSEKSQPVTFKFTTDDVPECQSDFHNFHHFGSTQSDIECPSCKQCEYYDDEFLDEDKKNDDCAEWTVTIDDDSEDDS